MNAKEFEKRFSRAASREEKMTLLDARAEDLFDKEKYSEAIQFYSKAFRLATQANVKAYFSGQIGISHYNLGNDEAARRFLIRSAGQFEPAAAEFMPDMCGYVHFHLGSLFEYQGRVAKSLEARKVCEKYVDSQEKDTQWMLYSGLSRNFEALGKHDESIQYSQKAIEVLSDNDPGLTYLYESMANNHMSLRQYPEAIKYYSKVLELDPEFERRDEMYLQIANCHHCLTNDRMALETYNKILELKQLSGRRGSVVWLYARIAHCHFRLEQYEKSLLTTLEALRKRIPSKVEKAELRSYLTSNYYELGRYREAAHEGEQTLKLARQFRNHDIFYFRMALSYQKLGDKKHFQKYRELCRKMFPSDGWNKFLEKLA